MIWLSKQYTVLPIPQPEYLGLKSRGWGGSGSSPHFTWLTCQSFASCPFNTVLAELEVLIPKRHMLPSEFTTWFHWIGSWHCHLATWCSFCLETSGQRRGLLYRLCRFILITKGNWGQGGLYQSPDLLGCLMILPCFIVNINAYYYN